ncbi:UNKNOWN [Stylonychia lemnae]|uniref:Uncharacterized protein n=1 Tax=Stylonychia lemnae TaxID=5949 RepID=A0A077ZUL8_STYLE|nr:UNKNOWN [Stylonychia lemnae]|eukprot:CDW73582.1 UNKNOWN [Stylonychia lemnae]
MNLFKKSTLTEFHDTEFPDVSDMQIQGQKQTKSEELKLNQSLDNHSKKNSETNLQEDNSRLSASKILSHTQDLRSQPKNPSQKSQTKHEQQLDFLNVFKQYGKLIDKKLIRHKKLKKTNRKMEATLNLMNKHSVQEEKNVQQKKSKQNFLDQFQWLNQHQNFLQRRQSSLNQDKKKQKLNTEQLNNPIKFLKPVPYQFNLAEKLVNNGRPLSQRSHTVSNIAQMPQKEIIIDDFKFRLEDVVKLMKRNFSDDLLQNKKERTPIKTPNYAKRKNSESGQLAQKSNRANKIIQQSNVNSNNNNRRRVLISSHRVKIIAQGQQNTLLTHQLYVRYQLIAKDENRYLDKKLFFEQSENQENQDEQLFYHETRTKKYYLLMRDTPGNILLPVITNPFNIGNDKSERRVSYKGKRQVKIKSDNIILERLSNKSSTLTRLNFINDQILNELEVSYLSYIEQLDQDFFIDVFRDNGFKDQHFAGDLLYIDINQGLTTKLNWKFLEFVQKVIFNSQVELYADMTVIDEIRKEDNKYITPNFSKSNFYEVGHYQFRENRWMQRKSMKREIKKVLITDPVSIQRNLKDNINLMMAFQNRVNKIYQFHLKLKPLKTELTLKLAPIKQERSHKKLHVAI